MSLPKLCMDCSRVGQWGHHGRCPAHAKVVEARRYQARARRNPVNARLRKQVVLASPRCAFCGTTSDLTADHVLPQSLGGRDELANLRVLCRRCNGRRGAGRSLGSSVR